MHSDTRPAVLPIAFQDGLSLDPGVARKIGECHAADFSRADPFPHIVLDNFLPTEVVASLARDFPERPVMHEEAHLHKHAGYRKRQISPTYCNNSAKQTFSFLNSEAVLQFLEGLTALSGLISDPYFEGGGFHEIVRGGSLNIHADFRVSERLKLARRLNLLLYLNERWEDDYGGFLELWDKSLKEKRKAIAPLFNRCVIFATDADSFHGHPEPLNVPEGVTRRSVALYYYTASARIYEDVPSDETKWVHRPADGISRRMFSVKTQSRIIAKDWLPPVLLRMLKKRIAR